MTPVAVPGPKGLPLIGALPGLVRDPFGFCMKAAAESDGLVRLAVGPKAVYLASHPDYVRHILVDNSANYIKGSMMDGIRLALGNGLFTSDGDFWKRQRRLMQPAFHPRGMRQMAQTIEQVVHAGIRRWEPASDRGEPIDVLEESIHLNIEIIVAALLGSAVDAERSARLLELTDLVFRGMTKRVWTFFLPPWMPAPGAAAYRRAIAALDEEIYDLIAVRRSEPGIEQQGDLLAMLLSAKDAETGEQMSDRQLRDEIFTLFVAGYESTATGVAWTCHLLCRNPEINGRLSAELDRVLSGRSPAYEDLPKLTYTQMVVNEALRHYPAFPMYFRSATETDVVGPYTIPAGADIVVSPYATHHDPRYWDDPEAFDPDRFLPERFGAEARRAYYPFGVGQRRCIGEPMALASTQLLLAALVQTYEISLAPGTVVKPRYAMTYHPKDGLPLILKRRQGQSEEAQHQGTERAQ